MTRGGFSLVEILVAVVVLEVGLLGVVGTLVLAARELEGAQRLERAVSAMEAIYDSLRASGAGGGEGYTRLEGGGVAWEVGGGGALRVEYERDGVVVAVVHGARDGSP
ncbi:MAG: hypothetical protein AMXMBFR53_34040 [Gemmatimonadota bacterium]